MSQTILRYPILTQSLQRAPIVDRAGYDYFVHPLSDGVPAVDPELLQEASRGLLEHLSPVLDDVDVLLTAEAMGLPLVAAVSLATGKPFVVARKRSYGLPGEHQVVQKTGYSESRLYLNSITPGTRVAIVDDVISTGGTLRALTQGLRALDAPLVAVAAVFSKDPNVAALASDLACPVSALLSCRVSRAGGTPRVEVLAADLRG